METAGRSGVPGFPRHGKRCSGEAIPERHDRRNLLRHICTMQLSCAGQSFRVARARAPRQRRWIEHRPCEAIARRDLRRNDLNRGIAVLGQRGALATNPSSSTSRAGARPTRIAPSRRVSGLSSGVIFGRSSAAAQTRNLHCLGRRTDREKRWILRSTLGADRNDPDRWNSKHVCARSHFVLEIGHETRLPEGRT
jgi:hypothetical protein